jgi:Family of unknown function (DUF6188)
MHGLKKQLDLRFLIGRELIQVAIGTYQVIFNFDEDTSIAVEGLFEYTSKANSIQWQPGAVIVAASTVSLLAARVETVDAQPDGTLKLAFSNGDCLIIRDASTEYESYQISRRGETIVV